MALVKACEYYTVDQDRDALFLVEKYETRIHPGRIEIHLLDTAGGQLHNQRPWQAS
jgi:hypothetical protein